MSAVPDNPDSPPQTAEDFARHLRKRAEEAAAASVQHAALSERYLELSQQFTALAQKASSTATSDLQTALQQIESALTDSSLADTDKTAATLPDAISEQSPTEQGTAPAEISAPEVSPTSDTPSSPTDGDSTEAGDAAPETTSAERHKGRARTRRLVERFRKAKLAVARRVRFQVGQDDLKVHQRTTMEELNNSRNSMLTSFGVMMLVLLLLSILTIQLDPEIPAIPISASFADEIADVEEPQPVEIPEEEPGEQLEEEVEEPIEEPEEEPDPEETEEEVEEPAEEPSEPEMEQQAEAPEADAETGEQPAADASDGDVAEVNPRSDAGRKKMLEKYGGSAASESAVQRGLEWLVSVQHPDGWWDFTRVGASGNPGKINNPIGGTAYALMPFLAAGQTHKQGRYKKQVGAGLKYLMNVGVSAPAGYDLRGVLNKGDKDKEPNEAYYVHGAATLVLCEAYGMTKDRRLRKPAEGALKFLLNSQDPRGGGWRYLPQQAGSTSVTAIQVMAMMAAKKASLKVPQRSLDGVMHYLDSVQVDGEGRYGYETDKKNFKRSVTAMALLCRMYLGWQRDDGDMREGIARLKGLKPRDNLYTTYFASQVLKNWGGKEWESWNAQMQPALLETQATTGPETGSWKPRKGQHTSSGGRLLETALATLTLEVYYRYKPILAEASVTASVSTDEETK